MGKQQTANGWQTSQNDWYYFNNGQNATNWQYINSNWYYLNPQNSAMETGLQTINNSKYLLNPQHDGTYGAMQTGWRTVGNDWYYFANNGAAVNGWQWLGNNWYYFDPSSSIMQSGLKQINNHGYYLNDQHDGTYGAMKNGWQRINGRWYGFGGANDGAAYTGWHLINNNWYYFNQDGEARTGWQTINGHRYYFAPTNNAMLAGLQTINNNLYYLNDQHDGTYGAMKTGWQLVNGSWYYFNNSGSALSSWQTINGNRYYFDPTNHQMFTGVHLINGDYYFFSPSESQQKGLVYNPASGSLQYYDLVTGVRQNSAIVDGRTLLFNSATGDLDLTSLNEGLNSLGNNRYYKQGNQLLANAWEKLNGNWYYFGDNAAATTGWYKSPAGFWYYFDPENAWAHTGWTFVGHNWYYMDPTNANMWTGGHWIDGHWVNLQSNGAFVGFSQRVINWFLAREGKLTYSMYGSRTGADGTADCSGSMTQAVWSAGGHTPAHTYSTLDLGNYLLQNGYYLAGRGRGVQNVQYGDIVIWGNPGASAGGAGHTVVISTAGSDPMCISTCGYYWSSNPNSRYGAAGQAVQEFNYQWYWNDDDRPYQMVYRPNFYWA